jgi:hypothetical protein
MKKELDELSQLLCDLENKIIEKRRSVPIYSKEEIYVMKTLTYQFEEFKSVLFSTLKDY